MRMNEIETKVGQISFSSKKLSKSFVSVASEKLSGNGTELYAILEIPNGTDGSSWQDYENVSKAVIAAMRSTFKTLVPDSFENCLAEINKSLSEMAAKGAAGWLIKMNGLVAARQGNDFYVSTVGKIHAYLLRSKQFSNIADSPDKPNAAKLFENFVVGKLARNDIVILTTSALVDYISMDRLLKELSQPATPGIIEDSSQLFADMIQESAGRDLSLGSLILGIGAGSALDPEKELKKLESKAAFSLPFSGRKIFESFGKNAKDTAQDAGKYIFSATKGAIGKIKNADLRPATIKNKTAEIIDPKKFKALPKTKKFFLGMASLFIVLLVADLIIGLRQESIKKAQTAENNDFSKITLDIRNANDSQVYDNTAQSKGYLADAESKFSSLSASEATSQQAQQIKSQIQALDNAINKVTSVTPEQVTDFGINANRVLAIANNIYAISYAGNSIISYNLSSKTLGSVQSLSIPSIQAASTTSSGLILLEDKSGALYLYNPTNNSIQKQTAVLPISGSVGLSTFFNSPVKAYTVSASSSGGVFSEYLNSKAHSETVGNFAGAMDIATDGTGEYVLMQNNILKFASGQSRTFNNNDISFGSGSRIFLGSTDCYVANSSNSRIVQMDKSGNLIAQYDLGNVGSIKDLTVNDQQKTAYFLSGSVLYSFGM